MAFLEFVSDEAFLGEVKILLTKAIKKRESAEQSFNSNVIDPFGALFESPGFHNHQEWRNSEMARQCQKTIQNHVGTFHQRLLGHVDGWEDMGTGGIVDLYNPKKKIIAEIKNKYSTVTGGDLAAKYYSLNDLISNKHSRFKNYSSYFVNIIPKNPIRINTTFTPSDKEKGSRCPANENIRIIDGASFYELVTGREHALRELHTVLPDAIECIYRNDFEIEDFGIPDRQKFMQYFELAYGS
ncbi:Eco47II family restriction endonuclease [Yersinia ruckeri]|uniref:Eco47II family restriction endonuclease n=1 Tax=Yersinia ruckeri TaxID=29486 RepID=UPI0022372FA7|nr:Eco47II family restriction endonuclease [Yersinia ruckeri]EKN3347480.1 Eco47II family restriction endonuclease [Yersinia ruckeri]MCW6624044.1 Eco47II family restriction endonuclease [Yersinia ruckeri]UZX94728.1 Eco47II family restriction endonuclease [Yersinia ruckeri]